MNKIAFIPTLGYSEHFEKTLDHAELWADEIFVATHHPVSESQIPVLEERGHSYHSEPYLRPFNNLVNAAWSALSHKTGYAIFLNPFEVLQHNEVLAPIVKAFPDRKLPFSVYHFFDDQFYFDRCEAQPRVEFRGFPIRPNSKLVWSRNHWEPSYAYDLLPLGSEVTNIGSLRLLGLEIPGAIKRRWEQSGFFNVEG